MGSPSKTSNNAAYLKADRWLGGKLLDVEVVRHFGLKQGECFFAFYDWIGLTTAAASALLCWCGLYFFVRYHKTDHWLHFFERYRCKRARMLVRFNGFFVKREEVKGSLTIMVNMR